MFSWWNIEVNHYEETLCPAHKFSNFRNTQHFWEAVKKPTKSTTGNQGKINEDIWNEY